MSTDRAPTASPRRVLLPALAAGLAALPVAWLLGARPVAADWIACGACALAQLFFLALAREQRAAFLLLAASVVQGLLAARELEGLRAATLALVPLVLAVAARRAQAAEPPHDARGARTPWTRLAPAPDGPGARLLAASALTLALCAGAVALALLVALLARGGRALLAPEPEPAVAGRTDPAREEARTPARAGGTAGLNGHFPEELRWESSTPIEDDTPLVRVRCEDPGALGGLLYLRGSVQERFTAFGLAPRAGPGRELPRGRSGWIPLAVAPAEERVLEFELEQVPLTSADGEESVLFVPTPLVALERGGARLTADGALFAPLPLDGRLRSRARALERRLERLDGARGVLGAFTPEALELPPARERAAFEAVARRLFRGAPDAATRRARVLAFFRDEFRYEPGLEGAPGLAGLEEFLARRAGICTHFAAAATLLLRLGDVPARVATGFLARPDPSAPELFVATPRGAHAWVEVWDEHHGWVTCDPTPAARSGGSAQPLAEARPRAWWTGSVELLASFLGGEHVSAARLRGTWRELVARFDVRVALVLVLAALALVAAVLGLRRRRAAPDSARRAQGESPAARAAHERLLAALARAGHPRPVARTLRAHAAALAHAPLAPLPLPLLDALEELVERLYRARFGAVAWSADDERLLARTLALLQRPSSSSRSSPT